MSAIIKLLCCLGQKSPSQEGEPRVPRIRPGSARVEPAAEVISARQVQITEFKSNIVVVSRVPQAQLDCRDVVDSSEE